MNAMIETTEPLLTRADRCDACSAGAMVRVRTENLGVFLFCGSHYDRSKDKIPAVVHVHDERNPLGPR